MRPHGLAKWIVLKFLLKYMSTTSVPVLELSMTCVLNSTHDNQRCTQFSTHHGSGACYYMSENLSDTSDVHHLWHVVLLQRFVVHAKLLSVQLLMCGFRLIDRLLMLNITVLVLSWYTRSGPWLRRFWARVSKVVVHKSGLWVSHKLVSVTNSSDMNQITLRFHVCRVQIVYVTGNKTLLDWGLHHPVDV